MALVTYILGDCPSCGGKATFGNIDVRGTYVSRGCGTCRYKERMPLPPIRKKILYLDQFFFSGVFQGNEERFVAASERIKHLAELQLIVVPYSTVHEEETHQWKRYADLLDFIKETSRGHEFSPAYNVERIQLEKAFEAWLNNKSITYVRENRDAFNDDIHVWESYFRIDVGRYVGDIELIRTLKEQSVSGLVGLFEGWRQSKSSFEEDLQAEHAVAANGYWQFYGEYVQRLAQGDFNALLDAPIMSQVVQQLYYHVPPSVPYDQRLKKVAEFFKSEHFRQTPYHDLSARIFASFKALVKEGAFTNTKKALSRLSGFFYDVKHIATYAPYCEAFIVDQPMAELISRPTVAISERYGVKIFSLNNWDEMFSWFDEIEASITDEHKRALTEAYPRIRCL